MLDKQHPYGHHTQSDPSSVQQGYELTDLQIKALVWAGVALVVMTFIAYVVSTFVVHYSNAQPAISEFDAPPIAVDQDPGNDGSHLALDEHGNAKGGIRNVWVDVPTATYGVFGKGRTQPQDRLCQLAGTRVPLADEVLRKLYRGSADYTGRVEQRLQQLVADGWFLPEYADMVRADAKRVSIP